MRLHRRVDKVAPNGASAPRRAPLFQTCRTALPRNEISTCWDIVDTRGKGFDRASRQAPPVSPGGWQMPTPHGKRATGHRSRVSKDQWGMEKPNPPVSPMSETATMAAHRMGTRQQHRDYWQPSKAHGGTKSRAHQPRRSGPFQRHATCPGRRCRPTPMSRHQRVRHPQGRDGRRPARSTPRAPIPSQCSLRATVIPSLRCVRGGIA